MYSHEHTYMYIQIYKYKYMLFEGAASLCRSIPERGIHMYTYVCIHMYIYIYTYICTYMFIHTYEHMYTRDFSKVRHPFFALFQREVCV